MQVLVVEVDMNSERMRDLTRYPAYASTSMHHGMYFIKDNKIVGKAVVNSTYNNLVRVRIDSSDPATVEFFKDDELVKEIGEYATFRFEMITGTYAGTHPDEPADRGEGLSVVDAFEFDLGIASRLRYGEIEGFGGRKKKNDPVSTDKLLELKNRFR